MKLYSVVTMVKEFKACRDVELVWFRCQKSDRQHSYADLIENYDQTRSKPMDTSGDDFPDDLMDAEAQVEQLFTEQEAKQLKDYLNQNHDDPTTISEAKLPIQQNTMGFGAIPCGGGCDCLIVYERPGYPLPFKVMAYYDLRYHEKVEGSGLYYGYHLVWDRDGNMRRKITRRRADMVVGAIINVPTRTAVQRRTGQQAELAEVETISSLRMELAVTLY
jgi:hypothetical protein